MACGGNWPIAALGSAIRKADVEATSENIRQRRQWSENRLRLLRMTPHPRASPSHNGKVSIDSSVVNATCAAVTRASPPMRTAST